MPLPRLAGSANLARATALCVSAESKNVIQAGDLLADLISERSVKVLAATGYVVPANVNALNDEAFLQTGQRPLSADVFARELRRSRSLPSAPGWGAATESVNGALARLFYDQSISSVPDELRNIDKVSAFQLANGSESSPTKP